MREDQKNLLLAMGLSLLVIIGWNYYYGVPETERARNEQTTQQPVTTPAPSTAQTGVQTQAGAPPAPASPMPTAPGAAPTPAPAPEKGQPGLTREQALAAAPRVAFETPSLVGSINLRGGRIDDLRLRNYRETIRDGSPIVSLLSPTGAPSPYFVESGLVAQPGSNVLAPRPDTEWTADRKTFGPGSPVTLTWDNGQGLIFRRVISVDDQFMFTIRNSVENRTDQPVTLFPYALTSRLGKPQVEGFFILHEGFVGIVGDSRVLEYGYDDVEKEPKATRLMRGAGGWVGITDKYWATAVIPDQNVNMDARFTASGKAAPSRRAPRWRPGTSSSPAPSRPPSSTVTRISTRSGIST